MKFLIATAATVSLLCASAAGSQAAPRSDADPFFTALASVSPDSANAMIAQKIASLRRSADILKLADTAEATIGSTASSLHNEVLYLDFLQSIVSSEKLSENDKLRPSMLLENSRKNQVGCKAADIAYELPDGTRHSILDSGTPFTLVYFNDPDCDACHKVRENMANSLLLPKLCTEKTLSVIGIYPFSNKEAWLSQSFPGFVSNGWDFGQDIDDNATYDLPTMPLFYLLDAHGNVILKNEPSLKAVEAALTRLTSESHTR